MRDNFNRPIIANVGNAKFITKAAVALYNFLIKTQSNISGFDYYPPEFVDRENGSVEILGQWCREAADVKEGIISKNNSIWLYSVLWQDKVVNSTKNAFDERY